MTYPEPSVAESITRHFVPVQIDVTEKAAGPVMERYRQFWTPDLRVLAPDGFELCQWQGYLPPFEFLPQLLVAKGHAHLRTRQEAAAEGLFAEVLRRFPTSYLAPEAQYYHGVARYRQSHQAEDLKQEWGLLQSRYPGSPWRVKQAFAEGQPTEQHGRKQTGKAA